uniref:CRAL-TRIO domain-containing protein n=1 Tax=Romanomermis culicivorax TaxID=13658 RepID=A0A915HXP0_ROMCU
MDAPQLKSNLEKAIAILPGSRDRSGGPIIIFLSHGDSTDFPFSDVASVLSYLAQIPDEKCTSKGYTVVIDMRHAWIKYMKTILKACQHLLGNRIRQMIIVKPEQFLEKQKINLELKLEVYNFSINFVHVSKLSKYIDLNQLTFSLFGTYAYDHDLWISLRLKYESFLKDGGHMLRRVENYIKSCSENSMVSNMEKGAVLLEADGHDLCDDLRSNSTMSNVNYWPNPDHLLAANRVETLCQQIRSICDQLKGRSIEQSKMNKEKSEKILFEQFLVGVNNVSDWLTEPGEKWLQTLHEIGESKDEAEQLKRDHEQLESKTQEIMNQISDLKLMADELINANDMRSVEVLKQRDFIDTLSKSFLMRVKHQMLVAELSVTFHGLVDEFSARLDELLDNLCSEANVNDINGAEAALQMLDVRLNSIGDSKLCRNKLYDNVMIDGQNFLDRLNVRDQQILINKSPDYDCSPIRDYLPGILHVRRLLTEVDDRKQRSNQLSDVRRLKLQQLLQLYTCERDADQAIKWLNELYELLVFQCTKNGSSAEETMSLRRDYQQLEYASRSTRDYGKQLIQISLVLRRSLRFEMAKNHELAQKLDECWSKFCRGLSERFTRLNLSQSFFAGLKQVNAKVDELCSIMSDQNDSKSKNAAPNDPDSTVSSSIVRPEIEHFKKQVLNEIREIRHVGQALMERIDQPLVPLPLGVNKDETFIDKQAVEGIRSRLSEIESKLNYLNT